MRPITMAARIAPYLRYCAANRPLDDHGVASAVLVVFDDDMKRTGVRVPLWGPTAPPWRSSGLWERPAKGPVGGNRPVPCSSGRRFCSRNPLTFIFMSRHRRLQKIGAHHEDLRVR